MACENHLIVQFDSIEKKDYLFEKLNNGIKLFETFIPCSSTRMECYGTSSDVYIEYITVEIVCEKVLKLVFHTHETPCIEFCKRFCALYNVNIQLMYLNEENNYSGKYFIHFNQIVKNEIFNYYQGLYMYDRDLFWENINGLFENNVSKNFMEFLKEKDLHILESDQRELKYRFDSVCMVNEFQNFLQK
jgi:hypothetical protein